MPRRARVELTGFHHVHNRAVEKKFVLEVDEDKEKFLETAHENLSLGMRQLNSKYATYL